MRRPWGYRVTDEHVGENEVTFTITPVWWMRLWFAVTVWRRIVWWQKPLAVPAVLWWGLRS